MTLPVRVPRIDTLDATAELVSIAAVDTAVRAGDVIADITCDKVDLAVEAPCDGIVLKLGATLGDRVCGGAILLWLRTGSDGTKGDWVTDAKRDGPTLKARMLLSRAGIDSTEVPRAGERLRAEEVKAYLNEAAAEPTAATRANRDAQEGVRPLVAGQLVPLEAAERGMFCTVSFQKESAVPAYVERSYGAAAWRVYATSFQHEHGLILDPLLPLMAWRLAQIGKRRKKVNATAVGYCRYVYEDVNLGFAVQSPTTLYLVVVRDAGRMSAKQFCERLTYLQRRAMLDSVKPDEASGATIAFSSMAQAGVVRHVPVLPPNTSLIVAHSATRAGQAVFGATYDHRLLTGTDVAGVLQELAIPESPS